MPPDVVFLEPCFPRTQREFVRALDAVGARVTGIGERPREALTDDLRQQLFHYEQVDNVTDVEEVTRVVQGLQRKVSIQRLEAVVEAHVLCAAEVRERCGIEGTSLKTTYLCRDKPAMKEALRAAGVPCAQSIGSSDVAEIKAFVKEIGFPVVVKPRAAAGAAGTYRCEDDAELDAALSECAVHQGRSVAVEEFVEGHEGFWDTVSIGGEVVHEFVCHYFPGVLEAMRTRWISPQFICTNRVDSSAGYDEVKEMGRKVLTTLGIGTSATHMEWFSGPKGLKFSEIGCRPAGVGAWDLYCASNDFDIYRAWADAVMFKAVNQSLSRQYSAGVIALRPDRDGRIVGYDGVAEIERAFGEWILDAHMPPIGTPTQPVSAGYMANAWVRMKHPDYDELRRMLNLVGETVKVRAS